MPVSSRNPPVASFAPELLVAFKVGAQRPVLIPVSSRAAATRLRFRLHQLRRAMRREMHEWAAIASGTQVTIQPPTAKQPEWIVEVAPADSEILSSLKSAGIEVEDPPAPVSEAEQSAVDAYLDTKREEK